MDLVETKRVSAKKDEGSESPRSPRKPHQKIDEKEANKVAVLAAFVLKSVRLQLFDEAQDKEFLALTTENLSLQYTQRNQAFECSLSLSALNLHDMIYQYKNKDMGSFLTSSNSESDLVQIKVISKEKSHPQYENIDLDVDIVFGSLQINLKPDTLLKVLAFVKVENAHEKNDQPVEIHHELPASMDHGDFGNVANRPSTGSKSNSATPRNSQTPQKGQDNEEESQKDTILLKTNVRLEAIKLVLVHRKTHLAIAELGISKSKFVFEQRTDEMHLAGSLGNLQLFDMTNYPNTI